MASRPRGCCRAAAVWHCHPARHLSADQTRDTSEGKLPAAQSGHLHPRSFRSKTTAQNEPVSEDAKRQKEKASAEGEKTREWAGGNVVCITEVPPPVPLLHGQREGTVRAARASHAPAAVVFAFCPAPPSRWAPPAEGSSVPLCLYFCSLRRTCERAARFPEPTHAATVSSSCGFSVFVTLVQTQR